MSEYIFVHSVDKRPVGSVLGDSMPLHMTILPWFESDLRQSVLIAEAQIALSSISRIVAKTTEKDLFGPNNDIPVMRVARTPELVQLHTSLLSSMQRTGADFDTRWIGDKWNPHISDKPTMQMSPDVEVVVDDIDLAVRSERNGSRTLLHRFDLTREP